MPDIIKVILLGIVEGLTEFLPISSTGHLIVASAAIGGLNGNLDNVFEIFIQVGAVIAVIAFYRHDLSRRILTIGKDENSWRFWSNIAIAFTPAAISGLLLQDFIDSVLFTPQVVGISLIVGGIVFLIVENRPATATIHAIESVTPFQALMIGIAQTTALIPGVSRSGASILGGMMAGLSRQTATQFSFYLAIPTLGGASVYSLIKNFDSFNTNDLAMLMLGTVVSGIVAWMAVKWLLNYIAKNTFVEFGFYRIAIGIPILILASMGVLT